MVFGILLSGIWSNDIFAHAAYAQLSNNVISDVNITLPTPGQQVPVGELTISGTSADNVTTNCQVDVDWNDQKPYQKTLANGPGGVNDYSNWTFTYTRDYHLITNGTNELTARLSCTDNSIPVTWDTVDVLGTSGSTTSTSNVGCISNDDQIGISKLVNATNATNATTTTTVTLPSLVYNFEQSPNLSGSDCIDIANNSSLQLSMFSIASWFNTQMDVSNGSNAFIVTKGGVGSDSEGKNMNYGIWMIDSENIETGFENSSGDNYFVMSPSNYSDGNWHYVVGTYNGSAVALYVDGVQVASNLTTTSPSAIPDNTGTQPVRIGANSLELVDRKGDGYFTGRIGEIRLWNRSLSAEEVSAAYNSGLFNTTGQVLYLPFSSQNHPPVTDAGPDLTVNENQVILLNNAKGSDSDPEDTLTYKWTQIGGSPLVRLSNNNTATPVFNTPLDIPADTTFTLQFSVTDNHGLNDNDTMNVLVKNIPSPPPPTSPPELEDEAAAAADGDEAAAAADEDEAAAAADEDEAAAAADGAEAAAAADEDEAAAAADEDEAAAAADEDEAAAAANEDEAAAAADEEAETVAADESTVVTVAANENKTVSITEDAAFVVTISASEDKSGSVVVTVAAPKDKAGAESQVTELNDEGDKPVIENETIAENGTNPIVESEEEALQEQAKEKENLDA